MNYCFLGRAHKKKDNYLFGFLWRIKKAKNTLMKLKTSLLKMIPFKNLLLVLLTTLMFCCQTDSVKHTVQCFDNRADSSNSHPKAAALTYLMTTYVKKGLPGMAMLVHDNNGTWVSSAGKADIGKSINFEPCHVSKAASITKLFVGTLTM